MPEGLQAPHLPSKPGIGCTKLCGCCLQALSPTFMTSRSKPLFCEMDDPGRWAWGCLCTCLWGQPGSAAGSAHGAAHYALHVLLPLRRLLNRLAARLAARLAVRQQRGQARDGGLRARSAASRRRLPHSCAR